MIPEGAIVSGFISKIINDVIDVTRDKIRKADKDRKTKYQSFETRIYQVVIDVINEFTYGKYKNQDVLYDAAENLLNGFKNDEKDSIDAVKSGLNRFVSNVDDAECEKFIRVLCHEISKENNFDVYKEIVLINQGREIECNHDILQRMDKKIDHLSENITNKNFQENDNLRNNNIQQKIKSRTQEYLDKWNSNMFLNDFDKRDENAGVNVKLSDVYLEEHLPHYIWKENINPFTDLKDYLSEQIYEDNYYNQMLLILGQPGIGKSTLITWVIANFISKIDTIFVYQFASDLKEVQWINVKDSDDILTNILKVLDISYEQLAGKTIILDGFDEICITNDRAEILNQLNWVLKRKYALINFSLIILCRENYIQNLDKVECDYIILQPWGDKQIKSFCNVFLEKTKNNISDHTIDKMIEMREIFGIPLILYMVLALNISIEKESSIVDVYEKIFSLDDGGIYDRCLQNKRYEVPHRISEIKNQIHQISREIAIWMFENKSEEAYIPQKEYQKICTYTILENEQGNQDIIQDFKIGGFFKQVRHCEGLETEELYFVHRTIYEYFVVDTIYSSIKNAMLELSEESQEVMAGNIAFYLKVGEISPTIGEYLQHKLIKFYDRLDMDKKQTFYQWWENTVSKMMEMGMFYYTKRNIQDYKKVIKKEEKCFFNLLELLRLILEIDLSQQEYVGQYIKKENLERYIKYCLVEHSIAMKSDENDYLNLEKLFLKGMDLRGVILCGVNLKGVNLEGADLQSADLCGVNLEKANLRGANLRGANLENARLIRVDLSKTYINGTYLKSAQLKRTIFADEQRVYVEKFFPSQQEYVYVNLE